MIIATKLNAKHLNKLLPSTVGIEAVTKFSIGQEIFFENDEIDGLWRVVSAGGRSKRRDSVVRVNLKLGGSSPVSTSYDLKVGEVFGELELLAGFAKRTSTAIAMADVELALVKQDELKAIFDANPEFRGDLGARSTQQLFRAMQRLARLSSSGAETQLETLLVDLALRHGRFVGPTVALERYRQKVDKNGWDALKKSDLYREFNDAFTRGSRGVDEYIGAWARKGLIDTTSGYVIQDFDRLRMLADYAWLPVHEAHSNAITKLKELIGRGEFKRALLIALDFSVRFPASPQIAYQGALAAARLGSAKDAQRFLQSVDLWYPSFEVEPNVAVSILEKNVRNGLRHAMTKKSISRSFDDDEDQPTCVTENHENTRQLVIDCAALPARLEKDAAFREEDPIARQDLLQCAADKYALAYDTFPNDIFVGINLASMFQMTGNLDRARKIAKQVLDNLGDAKDLWSVVTRLEASLLLGKLDDATSIARSLEGVSIGHIASLRLQLKRLARCGMADAERVLETLPGNKAMAFAGPLTMGISEDTLAQGVDKILEVHSVEAAYGALARGSDIIAAETILHNGRDLHVILPFEIEIFRKKSVLPGENAAKWSRRFDSCLAEAKSIRVVWSATPKKNEPLDPWFRAGWRQAAGHAILKGAELHTQPLMTSVIKSMEHVDTGHGTVWAQRLWKEAGHEVETLTIEAGHTRQNTIASKKRSVDPFCPVVFLLSPSFNDGEKVETKTGQKSTKAAWEAQLIKQHLAHLDRIKAHLNQNVTTHNHALEKMTWKGSPARPDLVARFKYTKNALAWASAAQNCLIDANLDVEVICAYGPVARLDGSTATDLKRAKMLDHVQSVRSAPINGLFLTAAFLAEHILTVPANKVDAEVERYVTYQAPVMRFERTRAAYEGFSGIYIAP